MNAEKEQFLRYRLVALLKQIPSDTPPQWGKMSLQQMIEHFADSVRIASGRTVHADIVTPEEHLDKMRAFMMSDKPFKENTINSLMPEVPAPVRNRSAEEAIAELQIEINDFFSTFEKERFQTTRNPFFGDLNYQENVQLLYKHALHHLKQFGVTIENKTQA
ncbi:MAG: DinB family protein [Flavisolibacter sp.]